MTIVQWETKQGYLKNLEVESIKAKMLEVTAKLIEKKKIIAALKESHHDLLFSKEAAKAKLIREDEVFAECKNAEQRQAYVTLALDVQETELAGSQRDLDKAQVELDIIQDELKFLKYQARLTVAELQFMAD